MKTKSQNLKWLIPVVTLATAAVPVVLLTAGKTATRYVVHEWGTFTSVQGPDATLLDWRPLESSPLPKFVFDWRRPGLGRQPAAPLMPAKSALITLQRMETPVIYFYADKEQTVDVSVHFPHGFITEWYPQAEQIGPSTVPAPAAIAKLDEYAHRAGAPGTFSFASLLPSAGAKGSEARWAHVRILAKGEASTACLPQDRSGSHYFTARDTDANVLRLPGLEATNSPFQYEKFIFYRGVGNFVTPLHVSMESSDAIILANEGQEPLSHLFVLTVENHAGSYVYTTGLRPGERRRIHMRQQNEPENLETLSSRLSADMARALEQQGLYAREATAMVHTWKDSWFEEDGVRVLYVLPRAWTERTLPLSLEPMPRDLARVMVGRAEILTPVLEHRLADELAKADQGDNDAQNEVRNELRRLGRFARPALSLALEGSNPKRRETAWLLFKSAVKPSSPAVD